MPVIALNWLVHTGLLSLQFAGRAIDSAVDLEWVERF